MKKVFTLLLLFLLFGFTFSHSIEVKKILDFVTLDNFRPFSYLEDSKKKGIDVDIVKEMCFRMEIKCNIHFEPWKRVLLSVEHGEYAGGFAGFKTPLREGYSYYLDYPFHYSTYNIFVKKGREFPFEKIDDLYDKQIGINRGFTLGESFDEAAAAKKIKVQEVDSVEVNIRKLMLNRIDGIAANYHETMMMLVNMKLLEQVHALPHPIFRPKGAYLMMSKKSDIENKEELINQMNQVIKAMYHDGTIDKINKKNLNLQ